MTEVKIYKIESGAMTKVKSLLETEEYFEVSGKCKLCGKVLEGKIKASEMKKYEQEEKRGKIKPPEKKCECGGEYEFEKKELVMNEFARNGYTLRGGQALGLPAANYLYIKAEEDFFEKNEQKLLQAGAEKASDEESEKAKTEIEKESEAAEVGLGGIFK